MLLEVTIKGNSTVREDRDIYREFVDSREYSFCKMEQNLETSKRVLREWFLDLGYVFEDDRQIVEYIAFKI